jgi:hypothetical protein
MKNNKFLVLAILVILLALLALLYFARSGSAPSTKPAPEAAIGISFSFAGRA